MEVRGFDNKRLSKARWVIAASLAAVGIIIGVCLGKVPPAAEAAGPDLFRGRVIEEAAYLSGTSTFSASKPGSKLSAPPQGTTTQLGAESREARLAASVPQLERVELSKSQSKVLLNHTPAFHTLYKGRFAAETPGNEIAFYTVDPALQKLAESLVDNAWSEHAAVVAMEPSTGRILAIAGKSESVNDIPIHSGFPAASLFKIVTTTAALEKGAIGPESRIYFRGGTYALTQWNYTPDSRRDKRSMTVSEALGKSCNPVFGRIALKFLNGRTLRYYTDLFGFNTNLNADIASPQSSAVVPDEAFELSRTAAGFGDVHLSPLHAAAMMSAVANGGLLPRPILVDKITTQNGAVTYEAQPTALKRIARKETVRTLLHMMEATTTIGTSRKEFMSKNRPVLGYPVAAKTGTLRGENPLGLNKWFIAAAPLQNPKIAVAVIVVDDDFIGTKASKVGRILIEKYLSKN